MRQDKTATLIRQDNLQVLTSDNSLEKALLEAGVSAEEASKFRHHVNRYLGCDQLEKPPDVATVRIQPGDYFVLGTKGLHRVLTDDRILQICREANDAQSCAESLAEQTQQSGYKGDVSCLVIEVEQESNE